MNYKRCLRCVMDNESDETIYFNNDGTCNYCSEAIENGRNIYFPNQKGEATLISLLVRIKEENIKKEFDCLMGLSGGLDSSYLAYLGATKWRLRILAVHIDDGYDTEISKQNIKKLCEKANIKLIVIKPDSEQFNDLTRSYILAGVPNLAVPQDNILWAEIYRFAKKYKIRNILSGGNYALECILQKGNTYNCFDVVNVKDIQKKYGKKPINKLPLLSNFRIDIDKYILKIETTRPLNLIEYNRAKAIKDLNDYCDFIYYGNKHLENTLTKFIQLYWFPKKFKVDKRKSHYSSMIISSQMTREEAIELLKEPLYEKETMQKEIESILKCLDISRVELEDIISSRPKQHLEYKTSKYVKIKAIISKMI